MSTAPASPATVAGFTVGQQVWFIRRGLVVTGIINDFRPWVTNTAKYSAELSLVDDLTAHVDTDDLFSGEVDATQALLDESVLQVSYLRQRLRELAKQTTAKARKAAKAARKGAA